MSGPTSPTLRPPLARSLLVSLSATFIGCLLAFGTAVHFLIVAPATQSLARVQLDLATAHIQSEAERSFRRIETQLGTARAWGQAGHLNVNDGPGFQALMAPLLNDENRISAIRLLNADGRQLTLSRDAAAPHSETRSPPGRDSGTAEHPTWSAPYRTPGSGDGCITVSVGWRGADGSLRLLASACWPSTSAWPSCPG